MIKTFKEIVREQLEAGVNAASEKYKEAVRPIYGVDRNGRPSHIGSCFLLEFQSKKYLITAAHVIDHSETTTLRIGGSTDLVILEGEFFMTVAPEDVRANDHYDFAWIRISEEFFSSLGGVGIIKESDISPRLLNSKGRVYLCLGYPRSKNKKADPTTRKLRPKRARYYSTWQEMPELYADIGISDDDHIAIGRKMRSRDGEGLIVNSIGPRGMSGGPLIDIGGMVSIQEFSTGVTNPPKLSGVLIEHYAEHDAILSVKIDLVIKSIATHAN